MEENRDNVDDINFTILVAGGRSRLHLIDLGGCANRSGGLSLSGLGNTLLSILSGQKHPPNRDHPLTPLLKDCLSPITCHVAVLAHISLTQVGDLHFGSHIGSLIVFLLFVTVPFGCVNHHTVSLQNSSDTPKKVTVSAVGRQKSGSWGNEHELDRLIGRLRTGSVQFGLVRGHGHLHGSVQ